jgi:hypothetical protein
MPLWLVVVALILAYHFGHEEGVRQGFAATGNAPVVVPPGVTVFDPTAPVRETRRDDGVIRGRA